MAENSEIVFRWVIDDAAATLARKKAESGVFNEGGFKWKFALDGDANKDRQLAAFVLHCGVDHNRPWKCEVDANLNLLKADGSHMPFLRKRYKLNETNCRSVAQDYMFWYRFNDPLLVTNNKITFEIHISSLEGSKMIVDSALFDAPNRRSDVILKIGEEKLHVSKEILAIHSPVFETMFFGDFSENGKEEVEIKDVVYEEFIDLLNVIYIGTMEITDHTLPHILKLSDQFQMDRILEQAKKHLAQSKGLDAMQKLVLADQHRLNSLRDQCLQSFSTAAQVLEKLRSSPEYANLSDGMKAAICDRMVKLP